MGIAAYNRGSNKISRDIDSDRRPPAFEIMDNLNALPKVPGAQAPFGPINLVQGHGGWWAECPTTGFGFWYSSLRAAVCAWLVDIVRYDATAQVWTAEPRR